MINLNLTTATRAGLNVLALIGIVVALRWGESILIPLVIAVLLAAMLWPAAQWLHDRWHCSWGFACLLVVGGVVMLNLVVTLGFTLAITRIVQDLPDPRTETGQNDLYRGIRTPLARMIPGHLLDEYFPKIEEGKENAPEKGKEGTAEEPPGRREEAPLKTLAAYKPEHPPESVKKVEIDSSKDPRDVGVFKLLKEALNPDKPYIISTLWAIGGYGSSWLWHWVLIMFILLFLMVEGRMLTRRFIEIFGPSPEAQAITVASLTAMAHQVRTYLVWRTIINFGLGLVVGIVYYASAVKYAWTWALLTAILCYIPYLGPIVAGVPPVLDAFVNSPSPWWALGIVIFYISLITLEGYVIVPVVMGRSMELNATTVMIACLFWELVWGLPGLFLAMPLMAAIKAVFANLPGARAWANLMSTSEPGEGKEKAPAPAAASTEEDTQILSSHNFAPIVPSKQMAKKTES